MKPHTLSVKRRPAPKGMFRRLSAVTSNNRKQRVAATANPEAEFEDGSSKISRALTIIFLIHIVAIGLIFVHQKFLDGRPGEAAAIEKPAAVPAQAPRSADLPKVSPTDRTYVVAKGDNYARIAEKLGVDEDKLRLLNQHVDIRPTVILRIPEKEPQRIAAIEPPEVAALRQAGADKPAAPDEGLVDAVDVRGAPRATVVKPNIQHDPSNLVKTTPKPKEAKETPSSSGKTYTVRSGDSIWGIANRHKISQSALMKANGISDPKKIKPGAVLTIP